LVTTTPDKPYQSSPHPPQGETAMTMKTAQLTIAGNTTAAPELKFSEGGKAYAFFDVAVNSSYQTSTGEWKDGPTSYHNVIVWGHPAENVVESIDKGHRVVVTGRLEQYPYEGKDGEKRFGWRLVADEIAASLSYATLRITKNPTRQDQQNAA
jgi:single-strand DNA-binding protein